MKKSIYITVFACAVLFAGLIKESIAQTGREVLNKAISFHDSLQLWNDYSGKVNLMTAFADNSNSGGETIEIKTKEDYYRNLRPSTKTVRGIENGKCYLEIDGKKKGPNETQCDNIHQMKAWHYFHFGILMELKESGLILGEKVQKSKFQGNDCLVLTFAYDAGKIKDDFYKDSNWTIYLDPVNYSMKGFRETGMMNFFAVFSGILNVNGIKIPLCRTYFHNVDNSFYMVDLFTGISEQ